MGGGGSQPSTMTQTSIPEYAEPYVKAMLGQSLKTVFDIQPAAGGTGGPAKPEINPGDFSQALEQYTGGAGMAEKLKDKQGKAGGGHYSLGPRRAGGFCWRWGSRYQPKRL